MGKTEEKFIVLLKLLNNCRDKLHSLCSLFFANLKTAKQDSAEMGKLFDEVMDCENEIKMINSAKGSKLIIKSIKSRLVDAKNNFVDAYEKFKNSFKDAIPLRDEYKKEVVMCCDTYKKMRKSTEMDSIEKGYRQQVKLIQAILAKIKEYIREYKAESEIVEDKKARFDSTCSKVEKLASNLG